MSATLPKTKINNGISYTLHGDYYLPDFALPAEKEDFFFGMYGRMRQHYLKNHCPIVYSKLLTSCKLNKHLNDIDVQCNEALDKIVKDLAEQNGVDEDMKDKDQMLWVRKMNIFKSQAREMVLNDIVYQ